MQLSRALFLSSERTRYHGACFVSVAASMASRAREYSYQRRTDSKSIWLSLLSVVIGSSRNPTSSYQMLGLFFFTIPNPNWDKRDYGYENCCLYSGRRLQGGRAPGSQNQKISQ